MEIDPATRTFCSTSFARDQPRGREMIREGTLAPDFTLDQVDGQPAALTDIVGQGHRALLVFLRYLG